MGRGYWKIPLDKKVNIGYSADSKGVMQKDDKIYLLNVGDGPEGIQIYTSEDEGVVDSSPTHPSLYVVVTTQDCLVKLGPFQLGSIYEGVKRALKPYSELETEGIDKGEKEEKIAGTFSDEQETLFWKDLNTILEGS